MSSRSSGGDSNASPYASILEKLRLPQPQLQRHAVVSLFHKLQLNILSNDPNSSPHFLDAVSQCLRSTSTAVADQAIRELCRLFKLGLVSPKIALVELQSALEGCDPRFVGLFVKAIGFVCRIGFRSDRDWGREGFDPLELHPFVKVLSCGEEAEAELMQQVLLFVVHNGTVGMESVTRFLRPFFMYSVILKSMFARNLILAVSSLACSFPSEAISIIKFLMESLKFFSCTNEREFKHLIDSAEYVVDAFMVVLKQMVRTEMQLSRTVQECGMEVVDTLLSLCIFLHRPHGAVEFIVELSKRLLIAQKEAGLHYLPEFAMVVVSISIILTQVEFEHEHLSILRLLIFLFEWRTENELNAKGAACYLCEELLYIFPVISLLSSPSKSVKSAAAFLLSSVERLFSDLYVPIQSVTSEDEFMHMNQPEYIPFRLLRCLWFQEKSHYPQSTYLGLTCSIFSNVDENHFRPAYWTCQLRSYLLAVEKLKDTSVSQSSSDVVSGTYLLLCSIASILVMHPLLDSSAVDCLAAIGLVDPKLGMPLLQALLFYIKMLCTYRGNATEMLLRLLEMLPSLASYSVMVPLIVQTILPMLQKDASPVLYAVAVRLLCKTWMVSDRAFGTLQEILDPNALSDFISERQICISIAGSIRDVCRHNPDRGVDLILSVSSCIESRDSTVQALGFESLAYLCEADVVDFYTAWVVVAKHLMDYVIDPIVAHGLCTLLSHGAMDAAAYPETSKKLIHILWNVATSRNSCSAPLWVKARVSAFKSLSHYEIEHVMDTVPDFRETNLRCLVTEDNIEVLMAMEEFETKIIIFEYINRRKVVKQKRAMVHKGEKLLDVFPQVLFSQGNHKFSASELPGAALLSLAFTPKDIQGTSKDMAKLHSAYEKALMEISESLHVSRNVLLAVLALQSWKGFMHQWIQAAGVHINSKGSSDTSDGISRAATDILKILFKVAATAVPRVAVNVALAIGALCTVVPSTAHAVISSASNFLLKWLVDHEHEHQQWSAAISLGLVCNCLHATDRMQKSKIITELLKAVSNSRSYLVKGACGVGLGFACQDLSRTEVDNPNPEGNLASLSEIALLRNIVRTLSSTLSQFCPSASVSLKSLSKNFLLGGVDTFNEDLLDLPNEDYNYSEEDAWGIAGLVLGLGNSVVAVYRSGAYDAVLKIKDILYAWVPQVDSSVQGSIFCREMTEVPLSIGSCLVLPTVMAFCQRTELIQNDSDLVYRYGSLISALLCSKKSGVLYQNLMMASCIGAGSFLSCILSDGLNSLRLEDVKYLMDLLRDTYTHSYPPLVYLGGMLGVVNAFGAGAGYLTQLYPQATHFQLGSWQESFCNQDSSFITGSLFSSPICNSLSTSVVQELFLMAKESRDQQTKQYAAWALSFLREKWLSKKLRNNDSESGATDSSVPSQNFAEDSLVLKLCWWLGDIDVNKSDKVIHVTTVSTALRCLSKAPRLPALDWGATIRRCMRFGAKFSAHSGQSSDLLREECICFSLAHANDVKSLMLFLDELTELSRFRTLELNLQCTLLSHVSDLLKIFSGSKWEKLSENLVTYFSSSVGPYMNYDLDQRTLLRVSFWKGLHQCLDGTLRESMFTHIEKCMGCLFIILPVLTFDGGSEAWKASGIEEWSVAVRCISKASRGWLMDLLQVPKIDVSHGRSDDEVAKRISTRARLVRIGCIPISELDLIKALVLNTRLEGCWWNVLMDVAFALSAAEGNTKTKWLLDALEISCIAEYPSTALRFVGLLSGNCCRYMPLLKVDPDAVLSDLPVTLSSLLSDSRWSPVAESASNRLWASTERICAWASRLAGDGRGQSSSQYGIDNTEAPRAVFLAHVLHRTCVSLKGYLPLQQQMRLASLEVPQL